MKWEDFIRRWTADIGELPPKQSLTEWMAFVTGVSDAILDAAIFAVAERYAIAKERDGAYSKAPTLWELRRAYDNEARERKKDLTAQSNGCGFCQSPSRVVWVIDNSYRPGEDFPADPETYTGTRSVAVMPCPECRAAEYGEREALRQRVKAYCVRESERDTLYLKQYEIDPEMKRRMDKIIREHSVTVEVGA